MAAGPVRVGRIVRSADFERVLRIRSRAQSPHFALHHLAARPSLLSKPRRSPDPIGLSTDSPSNNAQSVDDLRGESPGPVSSTPSDGVSALWFGVVVPKRHARRAVTRTLLKRQIRTAVATHAATMAGGLWVVRLRAGFDRTTFTSSASVALRRAARAELDGLFMRCAARTDAARLASSGISAADSGGVDRRLGMGPSDVGN